MIIYHFIVTLGSFSVGNALAWTSPVLPKISQVLCGNSSEEALGNVSCDISDVTIDLAGWVGPLLPVGAILVGPLIGLLVTRLGRKWTMVLLSVPTFAGWLLLTLSKSRNSITDIYAGRVLIGK
jgi:MFS family permease